MGSIGKWYGEDNRPGYVSPSSKGNFAIFTTAIRPASSRQIRMGEAQLC
jgi:hypothetical protein